MKSPYRIVMIIVLSLFLTHCNVFQPRPAHVDTPSQWSQSIVRVTVTSQGYIFRRPWQQRRPGQQSAIGAVVLGGRVLVSAMLVANHRYIELETLEGRQKQRADVEVVDYEANLALLKPADNAFLAHHRPLMLAKPAARGDRLTILQVKSDGDVVPSSGAITSMELSAYTQGNHFLAYRVNGSLQYRSGNTTLPVLKGNALAGLMLRNNGSGQTIEVMATSVLQHFFTDIASGRYDGFPRAGFHYGPALDPQLRRYIGLPDSATGIYVQKVLKGSPADLAGLQAGDVVTHIGPHAVSNTGQYNHPLYGKTSLVHLLRTAFQVGEQVPISILRDGAPLSLTATLDHRKPDEYLVPPYVIDRQPRYRIVGGLVFQELSLSYLREYGKGKDWTRSAPIHLLYLSRNQDYLNGDGRDRIVIISQVIPTSYTIGYEKLTNLVVTRINGQRIGKLDDLAIALATPQDGFHRIETDQHPRLLFLDPAEIPTIHTIIKTRYAIPLSSDDASF